MNWVADLWEALGKHEAARGLRHFDDPPPVTGPCHGCAARDRIIAELQSEVDALRNLTARVS